MACRFMRSRKCWEPIAGISQSIDYHPPDERVLKALRIARGTASLYSFPALSAFWHDTAVTLRIFPSSVSRTFSERQRNVFAGMPHRVGPHLPFSARELIDRLELILESPRYRLRHAIAFPTKFSGKVPSPRANVRDYQIEYVKVGIEAHARRLGVDEPRTVRRERSCDIGRNSCEPFNILGWRDRPKPARGVVVALLGVWRRCHRQIQRAAIH